MVCRTIKTAAALLVLNLAVAACAGGGGGGTTTNIPLSTPGSGSPASSTPPTVDPNTFRTADYLASGVLDAVHAADAYAMGITGKGITIGFVDYNFDFSSNLVNYLPASRGPNPQMQSIYATYWGTQI